MNDELLLTIKTELWALHVDIKELRRQYTRCGSLLDAVQKRLGRSRSPRTAAPLLKQARELTEQQSGVKHIIDKHTALLDKLFPTRVAVLLPERFGDRVWMVTDDVDEIKRHTHKILTGEHQFCTLMDCGERANKPFNNVKKW